MARNCLRCSAPGVSRGPYCQDCWLCIASDCFADYLLERIANEGASIEHLREKPPSNAELLGIFINVWEAKHAFGAGEVVKP